MDVRVGLQRKLSAKELMLLLCRRRLLRVPQMARRSNQSILKEISPEYSLEGLMLNLKLQYFGHLMQRIDSFEKTLMLGKIEGRRRRGWQRMRWLDGITDSMDVSLTNFPFLCYLGVGIRVMMTLQDKFFGLSFHSRILEEFQKCMCQRFSDWFIKFSCKAIWL